VGAARRAASDAHAAAREACEDQARAAARAAGHAVATAHMADHSLGAATYAARAAKLAAPADGAQAVADREHGWQREHLPQAVRGLVVSALEEKTVLGRWQP
jgi:Imm-5 like putative immunity protein